MKKLLTLFLLLAALTCPAFSQSDDSAPASSLQSPASAKAYGYGLEWDYNLRWVYYSGEWAYMYSWGVWEYVGFYTKNSGGNVHDPYIGWFYCVNGSPYFYSWSMGLWEWYASGVYPYRAFYVFGFGWDFEHP